MDRWAGADQRRSTDSWLKHVIGEKEAGLTVGQVATESMQVSRRMLQRLTRTRGIQRNGRPAFLAHRVRLGDVIAVRIARPEATVLPPIPMDLAVVHDDTDLLVLDKPAGILVHPTHAGHTRTLAHGIAHHFGLQGLAARVRPVHRLDRDTSGLLVVAKNEFAHQHLDRQLREGRLRREYLALVEGRVAAGEGRVDAPIGRVGSGAARRTVAAAGRPASTRYRVIERLPGATLLALGLDTGRTHQIRVHLEHLGHPVAGDSTYDGERRGDHEKWGGLQRQALHSWRLGLTHPRTGEEMTFEAPVPDDLVRAIVARRKSGDSQDDLLEQDDREEGDDRG